MSNKINIIFFGRLTKEKGVDIVLETLQKYQNNDKINFWIFWKWDKYFEDKIKEVDRARAGVKYLGWQNQRTIKKYLWKSHYCLMPSRFLETFGLSALESISQGVPVIWFAKWWLKQFIPKNLDINRQKWQNDFEKLDKIIKQIIDSHNNEEYQKISNQLKEKSKEYSKKHWIKNFEQIAWRNKRILVVSDFIENIGWIENYILETDKLLSQSWHKVDKFWLDSKLVKYRKFLMPLVGFNIFGYLGLRRKIKQFQPDIIWIHSASRYLWWLPLINCNWKTCLMMYHDFWYFHPFPSKVYEQNQIEFELNFIDFIKAWQTKNPFKIAFIILKFFSIKLLKNTIKKNTHLHLVPSEYMENVVSKSRNIDKKNIKTLAHFNFS